MRVRVNGEELTLESACTVSQLLARFDLGPAACAVEVNAELVPKSDHDDHALADGDRVEIVTLVGGG